MSNDKNIKKKRSSNKSLIDKIKKIEQDQRIKDNSRLKVLSKSTLNKRLIFIMIVFVLLFMLLTLYLVYFQLFKAKKIADNSNNRRLWLNEDLIHRGSIFDRNEN